MRHELRLPDAPTGGYSSHKRQDHCTDNIYVTTGKLPNTQGYVCNITIEDLDLRITGGHQFLRHLEAHGFTEDVILSYVWSTMLEDPEAFFVHLRFMLKTTRTRALAEGRRKIQLELCETLGIAGGQLGRHLSY